MKFRLLAGIAVTAIMASSAFAADMPLKAPPPVLAYDWSGFYIGGVIGGQWAHIDTSGFDPTFGALILGVPGTLLGAPAVQTLDTNSFVGGIEGGDRYQFGKLVVGWEADVVWGGHSGSVTTSCCNGLLGVPPGVLSTTISANERWTATATSTVGIAHDRWLIYGKAGVAWTHNDFTVNSTLLGVPFFTGTGTNVDNSRVGWTVGTGIEWAIWNNWSIKAEYDYLDFGTRAASINGSLPLRGGIGVNALVENDVRVNQFKAGLNWHIMPNLW
jgi:outer membrane immunogenic protein